MQIWLFFALLLSGSLSGQTEPLSVLLPRFPNLYGESASTESLSSAWINPASLPAQDSWRSVSAQIPFYQKAWPSQVWTLIQAPWSSPSALGLSFWGDADYRLLGLHALRKQALHSDFNLGLRLGLFQEAVQWASTRWIYDATLGCVYRLREGRLALAWTFGLDQSSFFQLSWQRDLDRSWRMSNSLGISPLHPLALYSSLQYTFSESLSGTLGFAYPSPWRLDISLALKLSSWQFKLGVLMAPHRGINSPTMVGWQW